MNRIPIKRFCTHVLCKQSFILDAINRDLRKFLPGLIASKITVFVYMMCAVCIYVIYIYIYKKQTHTVYTLHTNKFTYIFIFI